MEPINSRYPITASCSGYELRKDTSKYFAYEIRVHWSDGTNAVVYRRYSQFFNLQCKLLDNFPDEAGTNDPETRTIPFLPGKKLVGNLNEKTAEKRKAKLADYITALMKMPVKISQCRFVVSFFESRQSDLTSLIDRKRSGSVHSFTATNISEPLVLPKYQVIEPYTATQHGELTMEVGTVIVVVEKKETGWWFAQSTEDDSQGWVPASYLEPLYQSNDESDCFDSLPMNPERFVCTESYSAVRNDEVSAQIGEVVEVLKKNTDGWWLVMREDRGKQGYFPAVYLKKANTLKARELNAKLQTKSFVKKVDEMSRTPARRLSKYAPPRKSIKPARPPPPTIQESQPTAKLYTVIADFTSTTEGGLTLIADTVIKLILKDDSGWWLVEMTGGEQGWAPSTYLKPVVAGPPKPQRSPRLKPAVPQKTTNSPSASPKTRHRTPTRKPALKNTSSQQQVASSATKPTLLTKTLNSPISEPLSKHKASTSGHSNPTSSAVKPKPAIRAKPMNLNNNNLLNDKRKSSPETKRRPERPIRPLGASQPTSASENQTNNVKNLIAQLNIS